MKRNLQIIILSAISLILIAMPVTAGTLFSFSPTSKSLSSGQSFSLKITVNPQGVKNYTIKLELKYPADLLKITSFSFASSWMPISQPGYDSIDNTKGILIKTAGYPAGFSDSKTFGTVSFLAKKTGSGKIELGGGSLTLDVNNQNVVSGSAAANVNITAAVTPSPKVSPAVSPSPTPQLTQEPTPTPQETEIAVQAKESQKKASFLASVGDFLTLKTGNTWVGIFLFLLIVAAIANIFFLLVKRKS